MKHNLQEGHENYEKYDNLYRYEYTDTNKNVFCCIDYSLDLCRQKRNSWLLNK